MVLCGHCPTLPEMKIIHHQNPAKYETPEVLECLRIAINDALDSIETSRQKCLIAGQMLNEVQSSLPHGQFQQWLQKHFPQIPDRTARRWALASANIIKVLPSAPVDIEVSLLLSSPDQELTQPQKEYKQAWFDLTNGKTIKECITGSFVEGEDPAHLGRVLNGKVKGGVGKQKDRKAFEKFAATKLQHLTTFLTSQKKSRLTGKKHVVGWRKLSPVQQSNIGTAFSLFLESAPPWLLELLADKIKTEAKLNDAQRLSR